MLALHCCTRAFSTCDKQGLLCSFIAGAFHCSGLSCCGVQALGRTGFSSCGSCASLVVVPGLSGPTTCGIFPNEGWKPSPTPAGEFFTTGPSGKAVIGFQIQSQIWMSHFQRKKGGKERSFLKSRKKKREKRQR